MKTKKQYILFHYLILIVIVFIISCSHYGHKEKKQQNITKPKILDFNELEKIDYQLPYILELKNKNKHLLMYGCKHSFDPLDSMLIDIQNKFEKLKPDIALNEGGNWPIYDSKKETIIKSGEQGFLRFLCKKDSIPVRSFEPKLVEEYEYLISKFKKDDILLMYFCRQIVQIQRKQDIEDFKELMSNYLTGLKNSGLPIDDPKNEYFKLAENYKHLFKTDLNWKEFNPENVLPIYNNTILNDINRASVNYRDLHIVSEIVNELEKNDKVFVLIGGSHIIKQEALIKYYFDEINKSN